MTFSSIIVRTSTTHGVGGIKSAKPVIQVLGRSNRRPRGEENRDLTWEGISRPGLVRWARIECERRAT